MCPALLAWPSRRRPPGTHCVGHTGEVETGHKKATDNSKRGISSQPIDLGAKAEEEGPELETSPAGVSTRK